LPKVTGRGERGIVVRSEQKGARLGNGRIARTSFIVTKKMG